MNWVKIKKISKAAAANTYDIWNRAGDVYQGEGNFLTDGTVVHNSIPQAVQNRDDVNMRWRKELKAIHPTLLEILQDTYGVIVWQEQLAAIWQNLGGFTAPEAQDARKAVAKKWTHKLKPIRDKWLVGASRTIGEKRAIEYWSLMETFGRYAFNRSHGVSYCLVAQRCLWLKAHFAPEWWASVMSDCNPKKLVRYMGIARSERWSPTEITYSGTFKPKKKAVGVVFDTLNIENLSRRFTTTGDVVNQGLVGIKNIGDTKSVEYEGTGSYTDVDDFIEKTGGKDKTVCERFIKLGSFKYLPGHENRKAVWTWYEYKYCSGKNITQLRKKIREQLLEREGWNEQTVAEERRRMIDEYRKQYPNRRKIPDKLVNWKPKPNDSRERVMALIDDDYELTEILEFEKQYLGYYLHSPLDLYVCKGNGTIEEAKDAAKNGAEEIKLEVVIIEVDFATTRNGNEYAKIFVSDGMQQSLILMWHSEMALQNAETLQPNIGIEVYVNYDDKRNTFSVARNETIRRLKRNPNAN